MNSVNAASSQALKSNIKSAHETLFKASVKRVHRGDHIKAEPFHTFVKHCNPNDSFDFLAFFMIVDIVKKKRHRLIYFLINNDSLSDCALNALQLPDQLYVMQVDFNEHIIFSYMRSVAKHDMMSFVLRQPDSKNAFLIVVNQA